MGIDVYDFGQVSVTESEIEELAIKLYCENHREQPSRAMTQVFAYRKELFVTLANVNGPLETLRVVAVHDTIFLQELDPDELKAVRAAQRRRERRAKCSS